MERASGQTLIDEREEREEFPHTRNTHESKSAKTAPPARRRAMLILSLVLLIALVAGGAYWWHSLGYESTDDAQVDGHLNAVGSRVEGTLLHVYVDDNQTVAAGQLLAELDPADFQVQVDQARATLEQSKAQLLSERPNVGITDAENERDLQNQQAELSNSTAALAGAEHDADKARAQLKQDAASDLRYQADYARYRRLFEREETSREKFEQYRAQAEASAATLEADRASLQSSGKMVEQRRAQLDQANIKLNQLRRTAPSQLAIRYANVTTRRAQAQSNEADLRQQILKLGYCRIVAPVSGIITQRSAENGVHVTAGQQLMMIVRTDDLYVTANFKETQLQHMRPGQAATVHIDSFDRDLKGKVESLGGVTGSRSSVLPPENATGNFVKVVQRLPVRIRLDAHQEGSERLRPGLSVLPKVKLD